METININTGLKGFIMVDEITSIESVNIKGIKNFSDLDDVKEYLLMESAAQLAAIHCRWINQFSLHAFLLKITHCDFFSDKKISGDYRVNCSLLNQSQKSNIYSFDILTDKDSICSGELIISTTDYGNDFSKESIEKHYRKVYQCLTRNLEKK